MAARAKPTVATTRPAVDGESEHRAVSVRFGSNHGDDDRELRPARVPATPKVLRGARSVMTHQAPADHQSHCDQPNHEKAHISEREDDDSDVRSTAHPSEAKAKERSRQPTVRAPCSTLQANPENTAGASVHGPYEIPIVRRIAARLRPPAGGDFPSSGRAGRTAKVPAPRAARSAADLRTSLGRAGTGTRAPDSHQGLDDQVARPACVSATRRGSGSTGG